MNPMPSAAYYPQQNTRMGPRSVSEEEFNVPRQVSTSKLFPESLMIFPESKIINLSSKISLHILIFHQYFCSFGLPNNYVHKGGQNHSSKLISM